METVIETTQSKVTGTGTLQVTNTIVEKDNGDNGTTTVCNNS